MDEVVLFKIKLDHQTSLFVQRHGQGGGKPNSPLKCLSPHNNVITAGQAGQYGLGGADHSLDQGKHGIFHFTGTPAGIHILMKTLFCTWNQTRPAFFYPTASEANERRPGTPILQEGSSHSPTGPSVKSHAFTKGPARSQLAYTHHSSSPALSPLCSSLSPLRHTNRQSRVPPFHTVLGSKGGWRGM